ALVARDEQVATEHGARQQRQLAADASFLRVVVSEDVHAIDDRRPSLDDLPAEVNYRSAVGAGAAVHHGHDASGDVALVLVGLGELLGCSLPLARIEHAGIAIPTANEVRDPLRERRAPVVKRVEALDLRLAEALVPDDVEPAHAILRTFVDRKLDDRLACLTIHDERIRQDAHVYVAAARVQLRNPLRDVAAVSLVVISAAPEPQKALGLHRHGTNDFLVAQPGVPVDPDAGDRETTALLDVEREVNGAIHVRRVGPNSSEDVSPVLVKRV